jgi:DMSO/TMAO reductase YedYZ molybdopterin-dependent catalytic subunit
MRVGSRGQQVFGLVVTAFIVIVLGVLLVGCGGEETSTSTSVTAVVSSETTTSIAPITTTEAATSTTAPSTTTTAKATTTTAKATTTTAKATTTTAKPTTTTVKAKTVLTVSGPSGTKELSMAALKAMSATSGYGGWKNQLGNITAPVSWKGVSVRALMELVGGGDSVTVIASDGYEQTLSGGELSGGTNMYDPATGEAITSISGSLRVILAYAKSGGAIGSGEGPLRIAFVSPEQDQVTDSNNWVKMVISITVN